MNAEKKLRKNKTSTIKPAKEETRPNEHTFHTLIEHSTDGILILSPEGKSLYASPAVEKILGYTPEEFMQMDGGFLLVHPDDIALVSAKMEQIMANPGVTITVPDTRVGHKDGSWRWTEASVTNMLHDPSINGIVDSFRDVTERKLTEQLVQTSAANLTAVIENTDALIYSLDRDFKYITYNSALEKMMRQLYDVQIAPGQHVFNFINKFNPAAGEEWNEIYSKALDGEIVKFERDFNFNGFHSYNSFSIHPIWKENNVIGLSCFVNDITRQKQEIEVRKRAELDVLKAYKERNVILESIGDAFFAVDKNWIVTYWNSQAEKQLDKSKDEMLGKHLWAEFKNSTDSKSYKKYHQAIKTNRVIRFEDYLARLDKWYEVAAYPSENGLSVYFKDITQQKRSEEEREKMVSDLIQRNEGLQQFSYIVSHNLRAPVANIIGLGQLLEDDKVNNNEKSLFTEKILSSVKQFEKVINDLNNILKIKKEISEKKEAVNLAALVADIKLSLENLVEKEKVEIITSFAGAGEFLTQKGYLYSIFYNLITNSIKYHQPGLPPLIQITSENQNGKLIITFNDNGMGIDLEKKGDEVFGLYKRFHHHIEGKGMGLFMVKTQVEALGGKISISSKVNKGTKFKIVFELQA